MEVRHRHRHTDTHAQNLAVLSPCTSKHNDREKPRGTSFPVDLSHLFFFPAIVLNTVQRFTHPRAAKEDAWERRHNTGSERRALSGLAWLLYWSKPEESQAPSGKKKSQRNSRKKGTEKEKTCMCVCVCLFLWVCLVALTLIEKLFRWSGVTTRVENRLYNGCTETSTARKEH